MDSFTRKTLALGASLAGLGVMLGGFGTHALRYRLDPEHFNAFETGVRYQIYHSIALIVTAFGAGRATTTPVFFSVAAWLFGYGMLLFSGSLYMLALTSISWLGFITPIGGTCLIGGWVFLAAGALRSGTGAPEP